MAGHVALRWARALTLASVMLCAGYSGHLAAGGAAPPGALLGPMLVVLTVAIAPFLETPASAWRVVVLMLAGQGLLHVALELVGSAAPMHGAPVTHTATGPGMAAMVPGVSSSSSSTLSLLCLTGTHLTMLLAHFGAALVVALWLAAGERAAWTLVGVTALAVARTVVGHLRCLRGDSRLSSSGRDPRRCSTGSINARFRSRSGTAVVLSRSAARRVVCAA